MEKSESYNEMLGEVEQIVDAISTPEIDLDRMLAKVERGYLLIEKMRDRLKEAQNRIEILHQKFDEGDEA